MREHDDIQLNAIRSKLIGLEVDIRLLQLGLKAGYNHNQPRAPAGVPEGGQWIDDSSASGRAAQGTQGQAPRGAGGGNGRIVGGSSGGNSSKTRHTVTLPDSGTFVFETDGRVQTVYDGKGRPISSSRWTPAGAEAVPLLQPATVMAGQAREVFEAARRLYNRLSETTASDELVCLAFSAQQFKPNQHLPTLDYVGKLTRAETEAVCQRLETVQTFIDEAMAEARAAGPYTNTTVFGTAVHTRLRDKVRDLRDPHLTAEQSLWRQTQVLPLSLGVVRVDVLENDGVGPICVYDLKTGRRGLSGLRVLEFAARLREYGRPIIIIEMRPFE